LDEQRVGLRIAVDLANFCDQLIFCDRLRKSQRLVREAGFRGLNTFVLYVELACRIIANEDEHDTWCDTRA
jgi:hypothetical protein